MGYMGGAGLGAFLASATSLGPVLLGAPAAALVLLFVAQGGPQAVGTGRRDPR